MVLNAPTYAYHFMNYYKGRAPWYALPTSPGERYNVEGEPVPPTVDVGEIVHRQAADTRVLFSETGVFYNGQPIWLVGEQGESVPWGVRPVEWFYVKKNYRVSAIEFGPGARLIELLPLTAPGTDDTPATPLDVRFGDGAVRLVGVDVVGADGKPVEAPLHPGDSLGISLLWRAQRVPDASYTIGVYLMGPDGLPVLQHDSRPVGGFRPTTTWVQGERVRDNYGFILPGDLPAGSYELWLVVYEWPSLERLMARPEGGAESDHVVLGRVEVGPGGAASSR